MRIIILGIIIYFITLSTDKDLIITFDGDSLTYGSWADSTTSIPSPDQVYPRYINTEFLNIYENVKWNSYGISGQTLLSMISSAETKIDTSIESTEQNIIVAWEDVNAMLNGGRTAQQNYNDFKTYFQDRKDAGYNVGILITGYYPRKKNGVYNNSIWNDRIPNLHEFYELCKNTDVDTVPWDAHIDLRDHPQVGGDSAQNINEYFFDSVHLLRDGYDSVGSFIYRNAIINYLTKIK